MERFQSGFSLLDSAAAEYEMAAANFQGQAAQQGYALSMANAAGERAAGYNQSSALQMGSYGSLLEGVGNTANMGFNYGTYRVG